MRIAPCTRKKMATVVRVKRRRDEDPLDVLFLSHKKAKRENERTGEGASKSSEGVLKFAGRVTSKDDCISKPVREAIRKEKLEREYKQHQVNILGQVKQESRKNQKCHSQQSRYKITAKHRAIDLDLLDKATQDEKAETKLDTDKSSEKEDNKLLLTETEKSLKGNADGSKEKKEIDILCECKRTKSCKCELSSDLNVNDNAKQIKECRKANGAEVKPKGKYKNLEKENGAKSEKEERNEESSPEGAKDRMFCLVDVEAESESPVTYDSLCAESNQIFCNGVPLEKEVVSERDSDDSYVYDLYYTNSHNFDFRLLENVLTVEAIRQDYRTAEEEADGEEGGYEDEDSNDEGNWRNDYPDDDPGFIDNQDVGYYGNGLDENLAFETETGDQLADWMSWRCNIENEAELSSDDEVEDYEVSGKSYEAYYSRVRRELEGNSDSDNID